MFNQKNLFWLSAMFFMQFAVNLQSGLSPQDAIVGLIGTARALSGISPEFMQMLSPEQVIDTNVAGIKVFTPKESHHAYRELVGHCRELWLVLTQGAWEGQEKCMVCLDTSRAIERASSTQWPFGADVLPQESSKLYCPNCLMHVYEKVKLIEAKWDALCVKSQSGASFDQTCPLYKADTKSDSLLKLSTAGYPLFSAMQEQLQKQRPETYAQWAKTLGVNARHTLGDAVGATGKLFSKWWGSSSSAQQSTPAVSSGASSSSSSTAPSTPVRIPSPVAVTPVRKQGSPVGGQVSPTMSSATSTPGPRSDSPMIITPAAPRSPAKGVVISRTQDLLACKKHIQCFAGILAQEVVANHPADTMIFALGKDFVIANSYNQLLADAGQNFGVAFDRLVIALTTIISSFDDETILKLKDLEVAEQGQMICLGCKQPFAVTVARV